MSWIIQSLLNNRTKIKTISDIENDEYNDLLIVEKGIKELKGKGVLSEYDMSIIEFVSDGGSFSDNRGLFTKHKNYLVKDFQRICERIAFYLGGYFTDDGYIHHIARKYKLNDGQIELAREYMKSRFRHKIPRSNLITEKDANENKRNVQAKM